MTIDLSVVLPTYNERDALPQLHDRLLRAVGLYSAEVIVVDDNSPDGTADVVRQLSHEGPYRLISRGGRRGLASAVLAGFSEARGDVLLVMDADGSHPPEVIPDLVDPIRSGESEFALASRRISGGAESGLEGFRRLVSWGASILARPLVHVSDPMSGFFALDRKILARSRLSPIGFKIALEILVKCSPDPVAEVPFSFAPRLAGESKLGRSQMMEYLRHLGGLYTWELSSLARPRGSGLRTTD
jgi:dolichol-phosphate mannosyltransferase